MIDCHTLARAGDESGEQTCLMCLCSQAVAQYPDLRWLHHIPNGGDRNKAVAAKMKAEGVKAGVPDLFLPAPITIWPVEEPLGTTHKAVMYAGLYVEMKTRKSIGRRELGTSKLQRQFFRHAITRGYSCAMGFDCDDAFNIITSYLDRNATVIKANMQALVDMLNETAATDGADQI